MEQQKGQGDQWTMKEQNVDTCGFEARCLAAQSPAAPAPTTATAKGEELMVSLQTKICNVCGFKTFKKSFGAPSE